MLKRTKRIPVLFRICSVLSKVEPEPDLYTGSGSDEKVPAPTGSGSATLLLTSTAATEATRTRRGLRRSTASSPCSGWNSVSSGLEPGLLSDKNMIIGSFQFGNSYTVPATEKEKWQGGGKDFQGRIKQHLFQLYCIVSTTAYAELWIHVLLYDFGS